ncbi:obscurin-like [Glandiceps talaboti]
MTWFKDGVELDIKDTEKYEVKSQNGKAVLLIKDVSKDDEATYTCELDDEESSTQLLIPRAPRAVSPTTTEEAETLKQVCLESELPVDDVNDVKWFKDGKEIDVDDLDEFEVKVQDGKAILVVKDVEPDDVGDHDFTCIVGTKESTTTLLVEEAEEKQKPERKGKKMLTLNTDIPVSDVKDSTWLKDHIELDVTDTDKYNATIKDGKAALVIRDVDKDDQAEYTCQVGEMEASTELKITKEPEEILQKHKPEIRSEKIIMLNTDIPASDVEDTTWFKDGIELDLTDTDKYDVTVKDGKASLVIKDVDKDDQAKYTCQVGSVEASTKLRLPEEPEEILLIQKPERRGKKTVSLTTDIPITDVKDTTWFKDGIELDVTDTDKYDVTVKDGKASLIIKDVDKDDQAQYTCQVGSVEASSELILPEEPGETLPRQRPRRRSKKTVTLSTDIPVSDVKDTTWFKNGIELDLTDTDKYDVTVKDGKASLIIKDVDKDDQAKYTCQVGSVEAGTELKLPEEPEEILLRQRPERRGKKTVTLSTDISVSDVKDTIWFKDGIELDLTDIDKYDVTVKDGKASLVIKDVDKDDQAKYTCQVGSVEASTELKLPEEELIEQTVVSSVQQELYTKQTVSIESSVPVKKVEDTKWFRNGVEIDISKSDKYETVLEDGKATLLITDFTHDDEAVYTCKIGDSKTSTRIYYDEGKWNFPWLSKSDKSFVIANLLVFIQNPGNT